ncbi:MAG TPA: tryptophan 7-halogenase [Caulobacterales bacterium]|nr:tryptophan 7-halogenase [Caulobacterales bacterium]
MSRSVERVVVVGRDVAAWLSALALARTFSAAGVRVTVLEQPSLLKPRIDAWIATPDGAALNALLGLDEDLLLQTCATTYPLGQRFSNWSKSRPAFIHAYDGHGVALNKVEFIDYWLKAREGGLTVALEDFSLGAVAAKQGRHIVHSEELQNYSHAAHGYHFDALAYALVLRHRALKAGVEHRSGTVTGIRREGERILAVATKDGEIEGDLFIDATGPEAALMREMPGDSLTPWRDMFLCDRVLSATGRALSPLPAFAEITAFGAGWAGLHPLQDRTAVVAAFSSAHGEDEALAGQAAAAVGMALDGDVFVAPLNPGARRRPWIGNCVAVGESAAVFEPLDGAPHRGLQVALAHLIALFPVDADNLQEATIYNTDVPNWTDNIRDFQLAHYLLNDRRGEPFWDKAAAAPAPAPLRYKIDLFARTGIPAIYDHESFQEENWISSFIGHGLIPAAYNPLVDGVDPQDQMDNFQRMLRFIASEVGDMPSLESHIELHAPMRGARF